MYIHHRMDFIENKNQMLTVLDVYSISKMHKPVIFDKDQLKVVEPHLIALIQSLEQLFHLFLILLIHLVNLNF
jgi:hypothetical protein